MRKTWKRLKKLRIRLATAWKIITQPKKSWVIFYVDVPYMVLNNGEVKEFECNFHGMTSYYMMLTVRGVNEIITDIDLLEQRLKNEVEFEEFVKSKKNGND